MPRLQLHHQHWLQLRFSVSLQVALFFFLHTQLNNQTILEGGGGNWNLKDSSSVENDSYIIGDP